MVEGRTNSSSSDEDFGGQTPPRTSAFQSCEWMAQPLTCYTCSLDGPGLPRDYEEGASPTPVESEPSPPAFLLSTSNPPEQLLILLWVLAPLKPLGKLLISL